MSRKEALSQFINQIHGRPVVVKLNSGVDYRGTFRQSIDLEFDSHSNDIRNFNRKNDLKFCRMRENPARINFLNSNVIQCSIPQVSWLVSMATWTLLWIKPRNTQMVSWKTNTVTLSSAATTSCTFQHRNEEFERTTQIVAEFSPKKKNKKKN